MRLTSEKIRQYNAESLHGCPERNLDELIVAEHETTHEKHIRLPSNNDKQTTEK